MAKIFVSYTAADKSWAEWIASVLAEREHEVLIQEWTFKHGPRVLHQVNEALETTEVTIAVLSPAYFQSKWCRLEWQTAMDRELAIDSYRVLFMCVRDCELPPVIAASARTELIGLSETEAIAEIEKALSEESLNEKPLRTFPGVTENQSRFPGTLPPVWQLFHDRDPNFIGRDQPVLLTNNLLAKNSSRRVVVSGYGGIGKTQFAVEYAYRYSNKYRCVWWIRAEHREMIIEDLTNLGKALGLASPNLSDRKLIVSQTLKWLRENESWLLIYDNAAHSVYLEGFLPQGAAGNTIITSRDPNWGMIASTVELDAFDRLASVEFLVTKANKFNTPDEADEKCADALAELLGDLPLALAQAAQYIEQTQIGLCNYLNLYKMKRLELWEEERAPSGREHNLATTFDLALEGVEAHLLGENTKICQNILCACSVLAPDNIPRELIFSIIQIRTKEGNDILINRMLGLLRAYGLVKLTPNSVSLHRLMQVAIKDRAARNKNYEDVRGGLSIHRVIDDTLRAISSAYPEDSSNPENWPQCSEILPHAFSILDHAAKNSNKSKYRSSLLNALGSYLWSRFALDQAKKIHEQAIKIDHMRLGEDDLLVADGLNRLGLVLWDFVDITGAEAVHERALEIRSSILGAKHEDVAVSLNNIAVVYWDSARTLEAKNALQQAADIMKKRIPATHSSHAIRLSNYACVVHDLGYVTEAAYAFNAAMSILTADPESSDKARAKTTSLSNLAHARAVLDPMLDSFKKKRLFLFLGKWRPKDDYLQTLDSIFDDYLKQSERVLPCHRSKFATILDNFGVLLTRARLYDKANHVFKSALKIRRKELGSIHPDVGWSLTNIGILNTYIDNHEFALSVVSEGLRIREKALGLNHPDVATNLSALSTCLARNLEFSEARNLCTRALDIRMSALGEKHPATQTTLSNLKYIETNLPRNIDGVRD